MSPGFHLVPAHSVVTLAEELAVQICRRENPLVPETVLIMNYAQRVWLQRFLAEKLGICANINFISPEKFLAGLVARKTQNPFERNALAWRIFETLKKQHAPDSETPREFLFDSEETPEEDFFLRANELGDLFWRYQSFRPQMICDWRNDAPAPANADAEFRREYVRQKNLWQALDFGDAEPPAAAWLDLLKTQLPREKIPPRIFAFAPSALPRIHTELLEKLAESSEVFLYYHNLSRDLWTESKSAKNRLRERLRGNNEDTADFFRDGEGNELLAAWGKAARPLAMHLIDAGLLDADSSRDAPPERDSLLHALQREIRDNAPTPEPFAPAADDDSLKISVAPSPLREMEILRDELIARFAKNPDLKPRDVLVMFTDLDAAEPFIRAAFENSGIPFSIADRNGTAIFPVAAATSEILRIARGELRLDEILALLDRETVRNALSLEENEAAALREILADAGIRWGSNADFRRERIFGKSEIDAAQRDAAELFAENNSWEFGLHRLADAFMHGNTCNGDLPDLTESAPVTFGKIFRLVKILDELGRAFSQKETRPVSAWCDFLKTRLVDGLFDTGDGETEILRETLAAIADEAENGKISEHTAECTFGTFCLALERRDWSEPRGGNGMLRGKVTFCRMQPMRNIPAEIICIAGLGDGTFPRTTARSSLDLCAFPAKNFPAGTAAWDRTQRDDDCLLFLESILAARKVLLLSYVGRDANDGQAVPPCVPLAKLRDFLSEMIGEKNDAPGTPSFETLHRLHGFSPEYFSENDAVTQKKFFSFSRTDYATLCGTETSKNLPLRARMKKLSLPCIPAEISSAELAQFLKSPAEFICKNSFGIAGTRKAELPESDDPTALFSALGAYRFHREFFEKKLADAEAGLGETTDAENALKTFRARELAAGRTPALAEPGKFEAELAKKIKDFDALGDVLPKQLFRADAAHVEVLSEAEALPEGIPPIRITADFPNLFRDESGALFLPLAGKKSFDWRVAAETFVAAQMLAATFPDEPFTVVYFAYDEKSPRRITSTSLARSAISPQNLLRFYAKSLFAPPPFFEKIPLVVDDEMSADDFLLAAKTAWQKTPRDIAELFVFGENAPETFADDFREIVFPFVRAVGQCFASDR